MSSILTPGELCKVLKIEYHQYRYLLRQGKIPAPRTTLLGSRRFYTLRDMKKIQEVLQGETSRGPRQAEDS